MNGAFTKSMARNIFYGGTVFFLLLFLVLTFDTHQQLPNRDMRDTVASDPRVVAGKKIWETNNCVGCHTLLGEGAYFAPELANVVARYGGEDAVKEFIKGRPVDGIPGRRSMPQFNLTDQELDEVATFLSYVSTINSAKWPPNIKG